VIRQDTIKDNQMNKIIHREEFVPELANRARFTKGDINLILDTMIEMLIEAVKNDSVIMMRGFFKLYTQKIPSRKGKDGNSTTTNNTSHMQTR